MLFLTTVLLSTTAAAVAVPVTTTWGGRAELTYDRGFAENVCRQTTGGVGLFNMQLIENDAAGAGWSEKGVHAETIWGPHRARKILRLDDPRALRAFLVVFTYSDKPPHPLHFLVNGHRGQITKDNRETYRWAEFPARVLKKGANTIELFCPEARSEKDGWSLYLARADEFKAGGGNPGPVGKTSFRSDDGGATWKESPFGKDGKTRAEYSVRLSLDRYRREGTLVTPVIDLWRGDEQHWLVPLRQVVAVTLAADAITPPATDVTYYMRRGTDPSPFGDDWGAYQRVGRGAKLRFHIDGAKLNRRYVQLKAVLATNNPTVSPVVRTLRVRARVKNLVKPLTNIYVRTCDNPEMRYPSVDWQWERADRPEFAKLRRRENLDAIIAGSRTEFEAQVRLMDHATKRWRAGGPMPEYPAWDALSILDRIDKSGSGGMCIQGNNFLAGMCMAYGWQARLVNITAHETCEVWNDDFGKWIYLDGYYVNQYVFDKATGIPLSILDMHKRYLDARYPGRPIDWMHDTMWQPGTLAEFAVGLGYPGPGRHIHNGISLAAFARMVPRNNWYARPTPRPLAHGSSWWPWNGYINWYDARTPPKRQYSWHTDRPQDMWPELNRVHVHATTAAGDDRLFLRFETYTPNFRRFEVNLDHTDWKEVGSRWVWLLQSGRNALRVRAVNQLGAKGKPTTVVVNRTDPPEFPPRASGRSLQRVNKRRP